MWAAPNVKTRRIIKAMDKNQAVIVAVFSNNTAAEAAIENLREWDKRVGEVKLGAIGKVQYLDGKVKSEVVHGGLFNRSMPISTDAVRVLAQELDTRVAVVVACDDYESGMVSDSLTRDGGRILATTSGRTDEEIAKEQKEIADALTEQAIKSSAEVAKRGAGRNTNRPL